MFSERRRSRFYELNIIGIPDYLRTKYLKQRLNEFPIPNNKMGIFASGLEVKEDASKLKEDLAKDIRKIFATGVTEDNYVKFFHNLLWYEETTVKNNMKKFNMRDVPLRRSLLGSSYDLVVPGLADKKLSLMLGDRLFVRPHKSDETFEAIIAKINKDVVNLTGIDSQFWKYCNSQTKFDIQFSMSRTSFQRMHRAVQDAVRPCNQCRVFPVPNNNMPAPYKIQKFYNKLVKQNPEQRSVVEHIVGGTAGAAPYLLHGPPGTGKTVTIVEAILQLVTKNPSNRILVCTDSNMAADHVASSLIKYAHKFQQKKFLLRACSMTRDWKSLPKSLEKYSNISPMFMDEGGARELSSRLRGNNQVGRQRNADFELLMFMAHSIVVTTLSYAASFANVCTVSHLFIDEAAQASEPACLIPICGLLSSSGNLTLAGDPQQLGPVVISHHARKLGLGLSLMERLMTKCKLYSGARNDADYTLMLRNNFRSDPAVLEIPNNLFYHGQLRVLAAADPLSSVDILGERTHSRAIVFHGVLSKEQRMSKSPSLFNNEELKIVEKYIKLLIKKHNVRPEEIGVVTPYLLQVTKIRNWLKETSWSDLIEVGTVEAFQGKEKRVIIISTVRSDSQLGFLVDDQRFNVALTRAKAKAVVVGNPLCLEKDVKWRTYMQQCREYGTYFGHDSAQDNHTIRVLADRLKNL